MRVFLQRFRADSRGWLRLGRSLLAGAILALAALPFALPSPVPAADPASLVDHWQLRAAEHPVPPMGWMTWYRGGYYGTGPTEELIRYSLAQMQTNGWQAAGYRYINIDAGWAARNRLPDGSITWDPLKFPSGLPNLIAECHQMGFRVGIYTEPNELVEGGASAGSLGHFEQDAQSFADWGVDYIKFDPRSPPGSQTHIQDFAAAVALTGRPMFLHSYLQTGFGEWVPEYLNSFRKGLDIAGPAAADIWTQFMSNVNGVVNFAGYVRPGFYLDLETIPLSLASGWHEREWLRGILSMHAILAAPMIVSMVEDPRIFPTDALAQDPDIIAINQDSAVNPPQLIQRTSSGGMVWMRYLGPVADGVRAVCLFNSNIKHEQQLSVNWPALGLPLSTPQLTYDCWEKTYTYEIDEITRRVPPGSAVVLKLKARPGANVRIYTTGVNPLSDCLWNGFTSTNGAAHDGATAFVNGAWTSAGAPRAVGLDATDTGLPLTIRRGGGTNTYAKGLSLRSSAQMEYNLNREGERLVLDLGFQARGKSGPRVEVSVFLDGARVLHRGLNYGNLIKMDLDVRGRTNFILRAESRTRTQHLLTVGDPRLVVPGD